METSVTLEDEYVPSGAEDDEEDVGSDDEWEPSQGKAKKRGRLPVQRAPKGTVSKKSRVEKESEHPRTPSQEPPPAPFTMDAAVPAHAYLFQAIDARNTHVIDALFSHPGLLASHLNTALLKVAKNPDKRTCKVLIQKATKRWGRDVVEDALLRGQLTKADVCTIAKVLNGGKQYMSAPSAVNAIFSIIES